MIKNIVFDLGGVIIDYNPEKTLAKYFNAETAQNLLTVLFRNPLWLDMDRGTLTVDGAMEQVKDKIPEAIFDKVRALVVNWGGEMPPFAEMPALIERLKARGYKIYLLSNAPTGFYGYKDNIPAMKLFDGLFISADYKLVKPDKEIYLKFLEVFSLKAEECFFIDDVQANIDGAKAVGIDGYRHNGDIEKLEKILNAINE